MKIGVTVAGIGRSNMSARLARLRDRVLREIETGPRHDNEARELRVRDAIDRVPRLQGREGA